MKRKEKQANPLALTADELISNVNSKNKHLPKIILGAVIAVFLVVPVFNTVLSLNKNSLEDVNGDLISLATAPMAAASGKNDLIAIPSGTVKANPFLPYRDISGAPTIVDDVPRYDLLEPPEVVAESSDAARVMDTVVSGILYDRYSPSAILNIEGNDYLVKKGDVVNNYKIVAIMQDSVTVQLGKNTYKAGIGEILTEGSVNHNDVSNLTKKFGGERK